MSNTFTIKALREELAMTAAEFANHIGLKSKSRVSEIEHGAPVSARVALRLEEISGGRIDAAVLNDDVAAARAGHVRDQVAA